MIVLCFVFACLHHVELKEKQFYSKTACRTYPVIC